ncbi:MAG: hypothetical protein KF868_16505 [Acidobacteria bacterium]|nr:hypothetical protein [Acidobacteriota bacterium]
MRFRAVKEFHKRVVGVSLQLLGSIAVIAAISGNAWAQAIPSRDSAPIVADWELRGGRVTLLSDFDGDDKRDIATGSVFHGAYRIEIRFGSDPIAPPVKLHADAPNLILFAGDVDRDQDQDIIAFDPLHLRPAAVWLNDGSGRFVRSTAPSLYSDPPQSQLEPGVAQPPAALASSRYFSRSTLARAGIEPDDSESSDNLLHQPFVSFRTALPRGILHRGPPVCTRPSVS